MVHLPSEIKWAESVAERMLDGSIVLVRGLPRTGKTELAKAVGHLLGHSAVMASGRQFTESEQAAKRSELKSKVERTVDEHGFVGLIFDDYGRAIRRSQGGALHSMLYGLLVDGSNARDIGALLVGRFADDMNLRYAGSPLLSRAETITQPVLQQVDAESLELDFQELRRLVGTTTSLASRLDAPGSAVRTYAVVEYLRSDADALAEDLSSAAIEVMLGAREFRDADPYAQQALLTLGSVDEDGAFAVADVVAESNFCENLRARSPGWPSQPQESVDRFVEMLAGVESAYWVDRYLCADPPSLRAFLLKVRSRTRAKLRLLTCEDRDSVGLADQIVAQICSIDDVEVRFMTKFDKPGLHDRHLALPTTRSGFVLPTSGVITSRHLPGSAVAVKMPNLPVDYLQFWSRASPLI